MPIRLLGELMKTGFVSVNLTVSYFPVIVGKLEELDLGLSNVRLMIEYDEIKGGDIKIYPVQDLDIEVEPDYYQKNRHMFDEKKLSGTLGFGLDELVSVEEIDTELWNEKGIRRFKILSERPFLDYLSVYISTKAYEKHKAEVMAEAFSV